MSAADEIKRDLTMQKVRGVHCSPEGADALLAAYRAEVLREAADEAHDEGDRLYDHVGIEHAEVAWGVASKLRRMARKVATGGAK
ncbi:hypothetical protein [Streptomyces sp. NBC_00842]|uniref:hypothetical protein n=1 Tax=Streptomyces sp. NBC_00842 TaxID=2975848 RepID=UPI00386FA901|nr:hypothetical protein OH821_16980 [Streptomyces sp. NBC_00842]